jgi:PAS domain-containing protein
MTGRLAQVLRSDVQDIARRWAEQAGQSSEAYQRLPRGMLEAAAARLVEGIALALETGNYEPLQQALQETIAERIAQGVAGEEVQRAWLLGCEAVYPSLEKAFASDPAALVWSVTQVERAMHRSMNLVSSHVREAQQERVVTELEAAQQARRAAERRLEALLEALGMGVIVINPQRIVIWTDARGGSARCGALAPGEVFDVSTESRPDVALLEEALHTGRTHRRPGAEECQIIMAIPIRDEDGNVVEVMGVLRAPEKADE